MIKIQLLSENAKLPQRAENGAAGYDLYLPEDAIINKGRNVIPLDFKIELNPGTEAQIRPRSGFSVKGIEGYFYNLDTPKRFDADVILGTIDESYRGNVGVIIKSNENFSFIVKAGTKIAQMVISNYIADTFVESDNLSDTDRGEGGFGHTGV